MIELDQIKVQQFVGEIQKVEEQIMIGCVSKSFCDAPVQKNIDSFNFIFRFFRLVHRRTIDDVFSNVSKPAPIIITKFHLQINLFRQNLKNEKKWKISNTCFLSNVKFLFYQMTHSFDSCDVAFLRFLNPHPVHFITCVLESQIDN